jgi:homoserine dehydrogenase
VQERAARGLTTRLVGRARRDGALTLRYEPLPRTSPLAVGAGRVAYLYDLGGEHRVHTGAGVGAEGTADAVLFDLPRLGGAR